MPRRFCFSAIIRTIYAVSIWSNHVEASYQDSQLYRIRHSAAHIMAEAMLERFPDAQIAIGPPIEDGFYYDFDLPRRPTEEDLQWVEKRMKEIIKGGYDFKERKSRRMKPATFFKDQPYKIELINDLVEGRVDENGNEIASPAEKITF